MASEGAERIRAELFEKQKQPRLDLEARRQRWLDEGAEARGPEGTEIEPVDVDGVSGEWIQHPESAGEGVFILMHGGGYVSGGCVTHRNLASRISAVSGTRVLVPDYRLAPEHPYPAGLQDVSTFYGALLREGVLPQHIAIGGDSAGGGLTATMLLALRDAGGPLPSSAVMLSPWTDLTVSGESYAERQDRDPIIKRDHLLEAGVQYAGDMDPAHPYLSPVNADLTGLPPLLVHVGEDEAMFDDSDKFVERARAAGVEVEYEAWPEMWHVWHACAPDVPEADEAIAKIGVFIKAHFH